MSKLNILCRITASAKLAENLFWRSWWVCCILIVCLAVLEQALTGISHDYEQLNRQYVQLTEDKEKALALQENLKLQINSQSDPAWVELTLKKGLGLTPEGQIKIFFVE